jgi:hypothetical protein
LDRGHTFLFDRRDLASRTRVEDSEKIAKSCRAMTSSKRHSSSRYWSAQCACCGRRHPGYLPTALYVGRSIWSITLAGAFGLVFLSEQFPAMAGKHRETVCERSLTEARWKLSLANGRG